MTEIKIEQIVWDEWNVKHINKHNVTQEEVEEVVTTIITHKKGYSGRVLLIGRTGTRIVSVVVKRDRTGIYYVVTARDADEKEKSQ